MRQYRAISILLLALTAMVPAAARPRMSLSADGRATANYTEQPADILPALKDLDVLYLSNNQPLQDPALRKAIFEFADAGKGLLLVHPGVALVCVTS